MDTATNSTIANGSTLVMCPIVTPLGIQDISSNSEAVVQVSSIAAISVNVMTMPFTIFFNGLVIFLVYKNSSLQRERFVVLAFLALTDFFTGLICQPLFIARVITRLTNSYLVCELDTPLFFFAVLVFSTSFHQIAVITYDKYVAIIHPFEYPTRITVKKLIYMNIVIYVGNVIFALLWVLSFVLKISFYFDVLNILLRGVLVILMVYWYAHIIGSIIRHSRQIGQHQQNTNTNNPQQHRKGAVTAALVLASFFISFIPLLVVVSLRYSFGFNPQNTVILSLRPWIFTTSLLGSFFNPLIYSLRTSELREKCFRFLGIRNNSNNAVQNISPAEAVGE